MLGTRACTVLTMFSPVRHGRAPASKQERYVCPHQTTSARTSTLAYGTSLSPELTPLQDTGKSMTDRRRRVTSIDLNRAGAGLMEIVSEPDIRYTTTPCCLKTTLTVFHLPDLRRKPLTMSEHCKLCYELWGPVTATWKRLVPSLSYTGQI